jgi:hypothetical protein
LLRSSAKHGLIIKPNKCSFDVALNGVSMDPINPILSPPGKSLKMSRMFRFSLALPTTTSAPLPCHYDFLRTAVLDTDASDYTIGAVLSQYNKKVTLQPCTFFFCKMNPMEINYIIHDK